MKLLNKILFILFFVPAHVWAQGTSSADQDITGMWKGSLYNDTTQKFLPYQIAISEENGKLTGYSYTVFDIDGKNEIGVKRIKIKRRNDELIIEDVELISNNYSAPPPKKVKVMSVVNLSVTDTVMLLRGRWSTRPTREYLPLTGSMRLERALDYKPVALYIKLEELNLEKDLSFVKAQKPPPPDLAKANLPKIDQSAAAIPIGNPDVDKPVEIETTVIEKKVAPVIATNMTPQKVNRKTGEVIKASTVADRMKDLAVQTAFRKPEPVADKVAPVIAINIPPQKVNRKAGEVIKASTVADRMKDMVVQTAFRKPEPVADKVAPVIAINIPPQKVNKKVGAVIKASTVADRMKDIARQTVIKKSEPVVINKPPDVAINELPKKETAAKKTPPVVVKEPAKKENQAPIEINKKPVVAVKEPVKTDTKKPVEIAPPPVKIEVAKIDTLQKKNLPIVTPGTDHAAENVAERKMSAIQSVFYQSDSLVLTLYDNGYVDGDTVSVLMNGNIIFSKQGLTTKANSKTIYIDKDTPDSIMLVMYAENLGSIPPNTGLLVVHDGTAVYDVRFSADLKNNAAILLRRKKKE